MAGMTSLESWNDQRKGRGERGMEKRGKKRRWIKGCSDLSCLFTFWVLGA